MKAGNDTQSMLGELLQEGSWITRIQEAWDRDPETFRETYYYALIRAGVASDRAASQSEQVTYFIKEVRRHADSLRFSITELAGALETGQKMAYALDDSPGFRV